MVLARAPRCSPRQGVPMTLAELFSILVDRQTFPAPQVKSLRTAVRYLAKALGAPDPEHCPLPPEHLTLEAWMAAVEARFVLLERQGSPHSLISARNIRSNLRRIFRAALAQALLSVPSQPKVIARGSRETFEAHQLATA